MLTHQFFFRDLANLSWLPNGKLVAVANDIETAFKHLKQSL
jgi:hypothetical protein